MTLPFKIQEFADKNNRIPFYRVIGEGEPLLMVHGYMVCGEMFYPVLRTDLAKYQLILPDLRGYGNSVDMPGPYSVSQLGDDMIAILNEQGIERTHLVGYSKGGIISQYMALNYPNRFKSLVLSCTFSHKPITPLERLQGNLVTTVIKRIGVKGLPKYIASQFAQIVEGISPKSFYRYMKMIEKNRDDVLLISARELFKFDSRPYLKNIKLPTLVVGGTSDITTPVHHSHMLAGGIPGAKIKIIENGTHALIETHTKDYANAVYKFISNPKFQ